MGYVIYLLFFLPGSDIISIPSNARVSTATTSLVPHAPLAPTTTASHQLIWQSRVGYSIQAFEKSPGS